LWKKVEAAEIGEETVLKVQTRVKKFADLKDLSFRYGHRDFAAKGGYL
jgi:hypothetical protein